RAPLPSPDLAPTGHRGILIMLWTELAADPRGLAEFDTLVDLRATSVALTTSDVVMLASVAKRQPPSQRAIVTASDADFNIMSMLALKAEGGLVGYGVCRTVDQAFVLLGYAAFSCRPGARHPPQGV